MTKTEFRVREMDCSAEEQLVRMRLESLSGVERLDFDLPARRLDVYHHGPVEPVAGALASLHLGSEVLGSGVVEARRAAGGTATQRHVLWWVLVINAVFFAVEMTFGLLSGSMGLVADSLDMLADASVYGLSLLAVGAAAGRKLRIAGVSGYVQLGLAVFGFAEVVRRALGYGEVPESRTMIAVAAVALAANVVCLRLLRRTDSDEAHMQASQIFTSNDIVINAGVMLSGGLVYVLDSRWPDLVIGAVVFVIVVRGAVRILRLARG